jgi:hypothetical protein
MPSKTQTEHTTEVVHIVYHTEITNNMQPCTRIYYSNVYQMLNVFRATHRSWSPLSLDSGRQPQTYVKPAAKITIFELLMMSVMSLETC